MSCGEAPLDSEISSASLAANYGHTSLKMTAIFVGIGIAIGLGFFPM